MQLTSPDFREGENIPKEFTCEGDNHSPTFELSGIPEGTTCLALIMDDPDAPMGTFTHWIFWNATFKTAEFSSKNMPEGAVEGTNGAGKIGYIGPCPPSGTHRYFFRVYALSTSLDLDQDATVDKLEEAIRGKIVSQAELVGLYEKQGSE